MLDQYQNLAILEMQDILYLNFVRDWMSSKNIIVWVYINMRVENPDEEHFVSMIKEKVGRLEVGRIYSTV